jgi:hypothetical protein
MKKRKNSHQVGAKPLYILTLICVLLCGYLTVGFKIAVDASTLTRPADPVVLTGADAASLTGIAPGDLVAFRYEGGWYQIPVQVDERAIVNYNDVYDGNTSWGGGYTRLSYTDSGTFTGGDTDTTLDDDDEIVFMAKDAGTKPVTFSEPAGVIAESGVEIIISDPLDAGQGYVYLFEQNGTLDPSAGVQCVDYQFNLLSGDYLTTYNVGSGGDPEDTTIATAYYERHFSDRFITDEIRVYAGSATGVDILDRHKNLFAPGVCGRSEDTFSEGEGAFICNRGGPVRAIRSYVGCNSGPLTQRDNIYYEQREDITTYLRVHSISGVMDFFDYSPDAIGMTYYNNLNTGGVTIDGTDDAVTTGVLNWELVTGSQGSLVMVVSIDTNITSFNITSFYLDEDDTSAAVPGDFDYQCTGDEFSYGASGGRITGGIPDTDPSHVGVTDYMNVVRHIYYQAPGATVTDAEDQLDLINHPLTYTAAVCRDEDGDGVMECDDKFPGNATEWADDDEDGLGDNFEQGIIDFDEFDAYETLPDVLPDDDFDNDGVSNSVEFLDGTDPTDPASHVPVSGFVGTGILLIAALALIVKRFPKKV